MVTEDKRSELTKSKVEVSPEVSTPKPKSKKGTGFEDKTPWDWLQVFLQLLTALALPVALFVATQWITSRQSEASAKASEQQQEEVVMQNYLDHMQTFLLEYNLAHSRSDSPLRGLARIETITTLRRLDGSHKGVIVTFLYASNLIAANSYKTSFGDTVVEPVISLQHVNLSEVDLSSEFLQHVDLSFTNLTKAILSQADLSGAKLDGANLTNADLTNATVTQQQLDQVLSCDGATLPKGLTCHKG